MVAVSLAVITTVHAFDHGVNRTDLPLVRSRCSVVYNLAPPTLSARSKLTHNTKTSIG
jgi:hypothetical protein